MIDLEKEFLNKGFIFDKTTQSLSAIPHDFNSCRLKINDYVSYETFNRTIEKLYENFLYLYRGCKIANFNLFKSYNLTISSVNGFPYFLPAFNGYNTTLTRYNFLSGSINGVLLPYNEERKGNILFFADNTVITCLLLSKGNVEFKFNLNIVEPLSGDIKFNNIVDLKYDNKNFLFVADNRYKNVYKYDIKNFLLNENVYQDTLFLSDVLGGDGEVRDNNKFKEIKNIAVNDTKVVVQDYGNKSFKLFDKNFNWISTTTFTKIFDEIEFFECIKLKNDGTLLCGAGKFIYEFILDRNIFVYKEKYSLSNYLSDGEIILKIEDLSVERNMFYLITNRSVKKVWINSLDYIVGKFELLEPNMNVKWLAANTFDNEVDSVVLYAVSGNRESFTYNYDEVSYDTLLNNEEINVYSMEACMINRQEYVQSFTILKSLEKIYINTITLLQNIKYKFFEDNTVPYPLISKKDYNKSFLGFVEPITFEDDFNIGLNEIFQADVINRCIERIVQLQTTILLFFINNESSREYLSPNPGRNIAGIKSFTYFSDESINLNPSPVKIQIFEELSPGPGILTSLGGAPYTGLGGINIS